MDVGLFLISLVPQSMVHELFGIVENKVDLRGRGVNEANQDIVLSSQDEFFTKSMYSNYGDLVLFLSLFSCLCVPAG